MALETWNGRTASQTDADSPLDTTLMDGLRKDLDHLRQALYGSTDPNFHTPIWGHNHDGTNSPIMSAPYINYLHQMHANLSLSVGDNLFHSNNAEVSTTNSAYIKVKEIRIGQLVNSNAGLRIKFDLKMGTTDTAFGRIYKNGVAVGTERATVSTSYITYSEDFTGINPGDLIQLYIHRYLVGGTVYAQNLRLYVSNNINDNTKATANTL